MDNRKQQINNFFNQYADRFNKFLKEEVLDIEGTAGAFSNCFIESNPLGVICGKNDEQFRSVIPQGYAFYKSIGVTSMDIISKEITILNHYHAMIKVRWNSGYTTKDDLKGNIEFDVIYFLQTKVNTIEIFAYITGDEQAALKAKGLI